MLVSVDFVFLFANFLAKLQLNKLVCVEEKSIYLDVHVQFLVDLCSIISRRMHGIVG